MARELKLVEDTLLLESNISGICKRTTIKKILLVEKKQKETLSLILSCTPDNSA